MILKLFQIGYLTFKLFFFFKRVTKIKNLDNLTPAPIADTSIQVVKKELPKPDINQMKPFKPTAAVNNRGDH